jgi:ADP-heptose:LPS heptosyltransferase
VLTANANAVHRFMHQGKIEQFENRQLKYIAYTGQSELIYSILKKSSTYLIKNIRDKSIFNQAISGCIKRIINLKSVHNYELIESEKLFLFELLENFRLCCERQEIFPREYFESAVQTAEILIDINDFQKSYQLLNYILTKGISNFPRLRIDVINKLALILSRQGDVERSGEFLKQLICHPYFIPDRNQVPEIFDGFSKTVLKQGNLKLYKSLLFTGLKYFYTNNDSRRRLYDQIIRTYKNIFKLILSKEVTGFNKITVLIHWCYYKIPKFRKIKLGVINKFFDKLLLAVFYILNYIIRKKPVNLYHNFHQNDLRLAASDPLNPTHQQDPKNYSRKILITRAMGGIGDLLMMTPGLNALKTKLPKQEIFLAIPRRYFPIFENNHDITLIDIEEDFFIHPAFDKWYNFSDCPAARIESRTAPKVKKNRIEIFARELGIGKIKFTFMQKLPQIFLNEFERNFANEFWIRRDLSDKKVVGLQLHSDESYRDYSHMNSLVKNLSGSYTILLFDKEPIAGYDFENVIKVHSLSLRKIFALVEKCNLIVAPDSSFVHIAAAFSIPTIALFGPIDGKIRTQNYPNCKYLDVSEELKCLPCWRNENIPCQLTGLRNSTCMDSISVNKIVKEVNKMIGLKNENIK